MDLIIDDFGFIIKSINTDNNENSYIPKMIIDQFTNKIELEPKIDPIPTIDSKPVMEEQVVIIDKFDPEKADLASLLLIIKSLGY